MFKSSVDSILGIDKHTAALNALIEKNTARREEVARQVDALMVEDELLVREVAKARRAIHALSNI